MTNEDMERFKEEMAWQMVNKKQNLLYIDQNSKKVFETYVHTTIFTNF